MHHKHYIERNRTGKSTELAPEPASGSHQKQVLEATKYMVVSGNSFASKAGDEMIQRGGNAIDALIATQMVLNLVEPQASGIGGGGFLLYYDKNSGKVEAYDGRETAPADATKDMFLDKTAKPLAYQDALKGGLAVATPGLLRMLEQVHKKHGKLPWQDLFKPAISLSKNGFPLSFRLFEIIKATPYIKKSPQVKALYFTKDGAIKPVGTIIKNLALADTLSLIAKNGADAFYKGIIAKSIVDIVHDNPFGPGRLSEKDIADYTAIERTPLCDNYRNYKLCSMPPPTSGGITILQTLKLLERFELNAFKKDSADFIHLVTDATRLSFADRNEYVADCDFIPVPVKGMLAPQYIKKRSELLDQHQALQIVNPGKLQWDNRCGVIKPLPEHPSTTHISIIDSNENAISMTSSIEFAFGSGLMTNGFFLNNQLTDFALQPVINGINVANRVEAGKRPRSSMSPMLVFDKKGQLYLVIGSPGGSRIISYMLQTLILVLDFGTTLDDAIKQPHYATTGNAIELEQGTSYEKLAQPLWKLGHNVSINELTSGLHGIQIKNKKLFSGIDPRREGEASGK